MGTQPRAFTRTPTGHDYQVGSPILAVNSYLFGRVPVQDLFFYFNPFRLQSLTYPVKIIRGLFFHLTGSLRHQADFRRRIRVFYRGKTFDPFGYTDQDNLFYTRFSGQVCGIFQGAFCQFRAIQRDHNTFYHISSLP